ncbi:MAG: cation diffusion facilitator family transporter [Thermoproteales archaeon]|nr:cation diffusion facilitator family transporter [Thermoproteales archaeon]
MSRETLFRYVAVIYLSPAALLLVCVAIARYFIGYYYNVPVLIIEGLHALIDFFVSLAVVLALFILYSRYAKRFPYGLFRVEDLVALALAVIIGYSGIEMLRDSFGTVGSMNYLALIVQAVSLPLFLLSAWFKSKAGQMLGSPSLKADATHTVIDVLESGAVLGGMFLYYMTQWWITHAVTILLASLGLFIAAVEVGWDSFRALLDLPRDSNFIEDVKKLVEDTLNIDVADIKARWAGSVVFLELCLRLHPLYMIEDAYIVSNKVRKIILSKYEFIEDVFISVEPTARHSIVVAIPQKECGLDNIVSEHFGRSPYFLIIKVANGIIRDYTCISNPRGKHKITDEVMKFLVGADVAETLKSKKVTDVIVVDIGEIAFSILLRHGIVIWKGSKNKTPRILIKDLTQGKLTRLKQPTREETWKKNRKTYSSP